MQIQVGTDNPVLRKKSIKIDRFDKSLKKLIKEMKETMNDFKGVGLAAPQVGIHERLVLVNLDQKKVVAMINPEIIEFSSETKIDEEGCLSVPGKFDLVERAVSIKVKFQDENSKENILVLKDLNARIVQHEIDHLNGVLFVDKIVVITKANQNLLHEIGEPS